MTALRRLPALFALVLLTACTGRMAVQSVSSKYLAWDASSRAQTRILVTFVDRSIDWAPLGRAVNQYRARGEYQNSAWSSRIATRLAEDYRLYQVAAWPIRALGVHCVAYEIASDQSIERVLESVSRDKRVDSVQRMQRFRVLSDPYFRLQTALQSMHVEAAQRWATGRNVTVAIIDTGADFNHPDLRGQITERQDFVEDDPAAFVNDIHGTAVAGVIAALADNGQGIVGIAPDAKLMALKACWPEKPASLEAVCDSLTLAKALDAAVRLKPAILNLSLTGPFDSLLARLINKAIEQHIIIVVADAKQTDLASGFPASMANVVPVRLAHEQRSTKPATRPTWIVAPGSEVLTTFPQGTYNFISGSSFAAAHVSGVIALLLELQPNLSAAHVIEILQAPARRPDQIPGIQVSGVVNACAAIAQLRGVPTCFEPISKQGNST
ncbi:MAG: S8 family peptidase [Gammaproteobacteria bacterium]